MSDREKVIKGLDVCVNRAPGEYTCNKCPYETDGNDCEINLTKDAIFLLKEQENAYSKLSKEYLSLANRAAHRPNIVRCKDCRYYEPTPAKDEPDRGWCNGRCSDLPAVHGDWFCGDGKRKEGR